MNTAEADAKACHMIAAAGLVAVLGWDTDDFSSRIPNRSTEVLRCVLEILHDPDLPGTPEYILYKSKVGIRAVNEELKKRGLQ